MDESVETIIRKLQGRRASAKLTEEELKLESLKTLYSDLKLKNDDVLNAYIELENERSKRNVILYQPINGVVDRASDTKSYIKYLYGTSSSQYKDIAGLYFKILF